jgi:hypothetical protein
MINSIKWKNKRAKSWKKGLKNCSCCFYEKKQKRIKNLFFSKKRKIFVKHLPVNHLKNEMLYQFVCCFFDLQIFFVAIVILTMIFSFFSRKHFSSELEAIFSLRTLF